MKKIISLILSVFIIFTGVSFSTFQSVTPQVSAVTSNALADSIEDGAILHAWCWSFNTIKQNLPDIAAAGYTSVQTSPINEVLAGDGGGMQLSGNGKWYYLYQPTNYTIGNYVLGSEQEFKDLCTEADKYNINIIVDVVLNHCSSDYNAINQSVKNISANVFHNNGTIDDYTSRWNITQRSLSGLVDFNTQDTAVQQYLLNYVNRVLADGADGLRFDAAKHIEVPNDDSSFSSNFWPVITNNSAKFQYLEVLQDSTGTDYLSSYANYGSVTASSYGYVIRESVNASDLSVSRISNYYSSGVAADNLVTWVESHDNYCNDSSWSLIDDREIKWAWAVICARGQTTPLFFSRPNGATESNIWGNNLMGVAGSPLYKDAEVSAVNKFHNAMAGKSETLSNPNSNKNVLMIERGSDGATIINMSSAALSLSNISTVLKDGSYTDKISGSNFTVSGGKLSGTVQGGKIAVFYEDNSKPAVSANLPSSNFYDSVDLTLSVSNATASSYNINGGSETAFSDGQKLSLGKSLLTGESVTLNLSATNANGTSTASYIYTKVKKPAIEGTVVYFDNSSYNWPEVYCYAYNGAGYTNGAWPGVKMTSLANNIYYYVLDASPDSASVMFSNGNGTQYPASGADGLPISKNNQKILKENNSWEDYTAASSPCDLYVSAVTSTPSSVNDGDACTFSAMIRNTGENDTDSSFSVQFYVDGILKDTVTVTDSISAGSFKVIPSSVQWSAFFGSHSVKAIAVVSGLNDTSADNNALKARFAVNG